MKTLLEITPDSETTYEMPDILFDWIVGRLNTHAVVLGTRLSCKRLYSILPPELQAMITVTTESNPRRFNGHKITTCSMDECKEVK